MNTTEQTIEQINEELVVAIWEKDMIEAEGYFDSDEYLVLLVCGE